MSTKEYYKEYISNLSKYTSDFTVDEKYIKLRKFLRIFNESDDRFLEAKMNISTSHNYMTDCFAWVSFKVVEEIITDAFVKYEILGSGAKAKNVWQPTIPIFGYKEFHPFEKRPHYYRSKIIKSDQEAQEEKNLIANYWNKLVIPFFDYFEKLYDLLPYIEDDSEINKRLNPIGSYQRKACIWYLCNHPGYENYKNNLINNLSSNSEDPRILSWLNATKEIFEVLESNDTIYDWNDKFLEKKEIPPIVNEFNTQTSEKEETGKSTEETDSKWSFSNLWKRKK